MNSLHTLVELALIARAALDDLLRDIEVELGYDVDGLVDKLDEFEFDTDGTLTHAPEGE